jgi:hypothetical protein
MEICLAETILASWWQLVVMRHAVARIPNTLEESGNVMIQGTQEAKVPMENQREDRRER